MSPKVQSQNLDFELIQLHYEHALSIACLKSSDLEMFSSGTPLHQMKHHITVSDNPRDLVLRILCSEMCNQDSVVVKIEIVPRS